MKLLAWSRAPGIFWFRICGWGLVIKDPAVWPPLFSERMGYRRFRTVFGWKMRFLKRGDR